MKNAEYYKVKSLLQPQHLDDSIFVTIPYWVVQIKSNTLKSTCQRKVKVSALSGIKSTRPDPPAHFSQCLWHCITMSCIYTVLFWCILWESDVSESILPQYPLSLTYHLVRNQQLFPKTRLNEVMVRGHLLWTETRPNFSRSFSLTKMTWIKV